MKREKFESEDCPLFFNQNKSYLTIDVAEMLKQLDLEQEERDAKRLEELSKKYA